MACNTVELTSSLGGFTTGAHAFYRNLDYVDMKEITAYFMKELHPK